MKTLKLLITLSVMLISNAQEKSVRFEENSYATEGLTSMEEGIITSNMVNGVITAFKNNVILLETFLDDWEPEHKIMGMNYHERSQRVFFVSPNYMNGSILSFDARHIHRMNSIMFKDRFIKVHIIDAGTLNDLKSNTTHLYVSNSSPFDGKVLGFEIEELLEQQSREVLPEDVLISEIDFANGLYIDNENLLVVSTLEKVVYKINLENKSKEVFLTLENGWPDDIIRVNSSYVISDNENGRLYITDHSGKRLRTVKITTESGLRVTPANLIYHKGRVYMSNLWKANTVNVLYSDITGNDINDYRHGIYSIKAHDLLYK